MMDEEALEALELSREDLERMSREGEPAQLAGRTGSDVATEAIPLSSNASWRVVHIRFDEEHAIRIREAGTVISEGSAGES